MRYLGIDYGTKRVGVALSNESNEFALPLLVLPRNKELLEEIKKICRQHKVTTVVVGESKNYAGEDNPVMEEIRTFAERISEELHVDVRMEPEFLTSRQAEHIQGKNDMHDASAASLILKSFLERHGVGAGS